MCDDLVRILDEATIQTDKNCNLDTVEKNCNLNIFDNKWREHLKKSYRAGLKFGEIMGCEKANEVAKKCLIWDYVAGMTDAYIIEEYESLSFKKIELH